jgi:hypothetical protein
MSANTLENLAGRNIGAWIGKSLINALAQPFVHRRLFPIKGAESGAQYLAGGGITSGANPRFDPLLQIAEGYGDRPTCSCHLARILLYDNVILIRVARWVKNANENGRRDH